jgi:hypothetical protein
MDYNITGRADFTHKVITTKHIRHPNKSDTAKFLLMLEENQMFSTSKIIISCIAGYEMGMPIPPQPLPLITIPGLIEKFPCSIGTAKDFLLHKVIDTGNREVQIESGQFFQIVVQIVGMLYTIKDGCSISHKECAGFSMLAQTDQGRIVLDEGSFDALNDFIVNNGGPDIRALPFNLASLNMLPEIYQNLLFHRMFEPNVHGALQLTTSNLKALPQEDVTFRDFLGDALTSDIEIDHAKLKALAQFMLDKGWFKHP